MANISITQLPTAQTLNGTEAVPVVQNGVTVQTTTGAIANSPVLTQTFLTVGAQPQLGNSRYLTAGPGLATVDGGAAGPFSVNLTGAPLALNTSPTGFQVKTATNTLAGRSFQAGNGLAISNPDGIAGNPVFTLTGIAAAIAGSSGTGMLAIVGGTAIANRTIAGVANQISVANGDGSDNPTIGLASNPIVPGTGSITVPVGTVAQRSGGLGAIRYDTDLGAFEGYTSTGWGTIVAGAAVTRIDTGTGLTGGPITSTGTVLIADTSVVPGSYTTANITVNAQGQITAAANGSSTGGVTSFSGDVTGLTPNTPTTGGIVLGGVLNAAHGGSGANSLTGYIQGTGTTPFTASSTVPTTDLSGTVTNAQLANSSVTINGTSVSLGGSATVTSATANPLTISTGLTGTSFNGSAPVTIAIDSTVATLSGAQTLTNKSISGSTNTLSSIGNSSLTNSTITLGSTVTSLGGTSATLGGLTSVAVTQNPVSALQLATKQYVDAAASNVNYHAASSYGTTADLGSVTYNNGTSGVGATITNAGVQAALVIDGHTFTATDVTNNVRILVKNETSGQYNGIYTLTNQGSIVTNWVLTRATDYDQAGSGQNEIAAGDTLFVLLGTVNANSLWVQTTPAPITVGTTALTFVQIGSVTSYSAGTGLTLTGTQFSIANTTVSAATYGSASNVPVFVVNAQGQLTSVTNTAIAIANTAVSGLGTMSTQNANAVAITGGTINGTTIGATSATTGNFTTVTATSGISGGTF